MKAYGMKWRARRDQARPRERRLTRNILAPKCLLRSDVDFRLTPPGMGTLFEHIHSDGHFAARRGLGFGSPTMGLRADVIASVIASAWVSGNTPSRNNCAKPCTSAHAAMAANCESCAARHSVLHAALQPLERLIGGGLQFRIVGTLRQLRAEHQPENAAPSQRKAHIGHSHGGQRIAFARAQRRPTQRRGRGTLRRPPRPATSPCWQNDGTSPAPRRRPGAPSRAG